MNRQNITSRITTQERIGLLDDIRRIFTQIREASTHLQHLQTRPDLSETLFSGFYHLRLLTERIRHIRVDDRRNNRLLNADRVGMLTDIVRIQSRFRAFYLQLRSIEGSDLAQREILTAEAQVRMLGNRIRNIPAVNRNGDLMVAEPIREPVIQRNPNPRTIIVVIDPTLIEENNNDSDTSESLNMDSEEWNQMWKDKENGEN